MYPHRIRLRGPWKCEPLSAVRFPPPAQGETRTADDEKPAAESGQRTAESGVRFRRSFGYPGRIDAHERVWLTFAGIGDEAEVRLNDHLLGRIVASSEFEVTSLLRRRNELIVEIEGTSEQGGLWGEVALEVRCAAYLRNLRSFSTLKGDSVDLRVSGQVVGTAERSLELYLLVDRSVVGYQVVTATAEGQAFEFVVHDLPAAKLPIQVDLVNGAIVWYTSNSVLVPTQRGEMETAPDEGK